MAQIVTIVIFLFFNLLSLCVASMSSGFRLKLIHRDSPHSPLYQSNISNFERFQKNVQISEARASHFQQRSQIISNGNPKKLQTASIRFPLKLAEPIYTIELFLGTPAVKRTLIFDTGSGLTWTHCKQSCINCSKKKEPPFNITQSRSYRMLTKKHKLSKSFFCIWLGCVYFVRYYSGQSSAGIASIENFTVQTSAGVSRTVPGLVFGCRITGVDDLHRIKVNGIFGMDRESVSFMSQFAGLTKGRFSYCLPAMFSTIKGSYLRFGDEAVIQGTNVQSTPFVQINSKDIFYRMNLIDISIGGQKLGFRPNAFPEKCVIDSGASVSLLNQQAFSTVQRSLERYFSKFKNITRIPPENNPSGLHCYTHPASFTKFPNMTYHFQGANFHVPSANLFLHEELEGIFCLTIIPSQKVTLLGAFQQQNVRVLYDLNRKMLSFAPKDCSKDSA